MASNVDGDIVLSANIDPSQAVSTAESLQGEIEDILKHSDASSPALQSLLKQLDSAHLHAEQLISTMADLAGQQIPTEEYTEVQTQIEKAEAALIKVQERMEKFLALGGREDSKTFQSMEYDAEQLQNTIEYARGELQDLVDTGQAFTLGADTSEYQDLASRLNVVNNQMLVGIERAYALGASAEDLASRTRGAGSAFSSFNHTLNVISTAISRVLLAGLHGLAGAFTKVASAATSVVKSGIVGFMSRLGAAVKGVTKETNKSGFSIKQLARFITKYGLGVRSFFFLYRKLRKQLVEGFENLAQVSEPFNQAVSSLMNALAGLKSSFASAFAPIIQVVAPALVTFINLISAAVDKVGMLIAALAGQKEYIKYVPTQIDYAQSVADTAKNANKASKSLKDTQKSAKELKRTLAGFDDVEILQEDKDTDTPSSGGSGGLGNITGGGAQAMKAEMLSLADVASEFAEKLKEAFKTFDFTEIGEIISKKLTNMLNSINWNGIYQTARNFGKGLATFLNGLISPELFSALGKSIASALNTALNFLDSFLDWFDWSNFGTSLGSGLREFFVTWDADLTASNFYNLINGISASLVAALAVFPTSYVGNKIGNCIQDALDGIDWEHHVFPAASVFGTKLALFFNGLIKPDRFASVGRAVGNALSTALRFLDNFGETFDWGNLGDSIAAGINGFFNSDFKFSQFVSTFNRVAHGILDTLSHAITGVTWKKIGQDIRDAILEIDFANLLIKVGEVIFEAINAALEAATGFFDGTPVSDAIDGLTEGINLAVELIDFPTIVNGFKDLAAALAPFVAGFAAGLIEVFDAIIRVGGHLLQIVGPCVQKLADALGSMDPEVLEAIGKALGIIAGSFLVMSVVTKVIGALETFAAFIKGSAFISAISTAIGTVGSTTAVAGGTIGAIGTGLLGIASALLLIVSTAGLAYWAMHHMTVEIASTEEELTPFNQEQQDTLDILTKVGTQYGLTSDKIAELAWQMNWATSENSDTAASYELIDKYLQEAGIDADTFKTSLAGVLTEAQTNGKYIDNISSYIAGVDTNSGSATTNVDKLTGSLATMGDEAGTTDTNTSGVGDALKQFDGLSLSTPLKLALISGAVGLLGENGETTDENLDALYQALDDYDPSNPEASMDRIATALEDAGISADDFRQAVGKSLTESEDLTKQVTEEMGISFKTLGTNMQTDGETAGKNFTAGLTSGLTDKTQIAGVEGAAKSVVNDSVLDTIDTAADMHSPSKKMQTRGENLIAGLKAGIVDKSTEVTSFMQELMNKVVNAISRRVSEFTGLGRTLISNLNSGITSEQSRVTNTISNLASSIQSSFRDAVNWFDIGSDIMSEIHDGFSSASYNLSSVASSAAQDVYYAFTGAASWYGVGQNIGYGIYDGLLACSRSLEILAWNVAVGMYNSACSALGIASPSKKFAWIGEMTMAGLSEGIESSEDEAVDAMDGLISNLTRQANGLQSISNAAAMAVPSIAQGKVVPNSVQLNKSSEDRLSNIIDSLNSLSQNFVTKDELASLLQDLANNISTSFYIGDEQIARHANAGNAKLERRYKPVSSMT